MTSLTDIMEAPSTRRYREISERSLAAVEAREFPKARKFLEWSKVEAENLRQPILVERAFCNVASLAAEMEEAGPYIDGFTFEVSVCRRPKVDIREHWPQMRRY